MEVSKLAFLRTVTAGLYNPFCGGIAGIRDFRLLSVTLYQGMVVLTLRN